MWAATGSEVSNSLGNYLIRETVFLTWRLQAQFSVQNWTWLSMEKLQNEFSSHRWSLGLYVCGLMSLLYIYHRGVIQDSSGGDGHWLVIWPFSKATTVSSYQTEATGNNVALFGLERYHIWTCSVESTQAMTVDCWSSPREGGVETVIRASLETETTPPSYSYAVSP